MDAEPVLTRLATLFQRHRLEAVLIGNAAAAVHGAPVTTVDVDFFFPETPANRKKLAAIAEELDAVLFRPYYPAARMIRLMSDDHALQVDFMSEAHGIRSFEGLRARAKRISLAGAQLYVADLADIIKSKKAAGRPRDRAVLVILEKTLEESPPKPKSAPRRAAKKR
jgi:predicted nucleotidyltransferase